jgi:hypothetical protein
LREGAKLAQLCGAEVFLLAVVETASSVASLEGGVMISMDEHFENYQAILAEGVERLKTMGFSPTARLGMGARLVGMSAHMLNYLARHGYLVPTYFRSGDEERRGITRIGILLSPG